MNKSAIQDTTDGTQARGGEPDPLEALREAWKSWRQQPSVGLEEHLVQLRQAAAASLSLEPGRDIWPPQAPDLFPEHRHGLVEIEPAQLNMQTLASAVGHHGALLVRGLVPMARVHELREGIDQAMAMHDAWRAGAPLEKTSPWFRENPDVTTLSENDYARKWTRQAQGVFTADSPRMLALLLDTYARSGVLDTVREYLGEHPLLSAKKGVLRRVEPDLKLAGWHQDGRFLEQGEGIHTINAWMSLSHCGKQAPGMDIIARQLGRIVETGTHSAEMPWVVAQELIDETPELREAWVRPDFAPGDVLFFDEFNLHRTGIGPDMSERRYAIESWFYAPSRRTANDLYLAV